MHDKGEDQDREMLLQMLFYWIVFVISGLLENFLWVLLPAEILVWLLHSSRAVFLTAMLSPKVNLKAKWYKVLLEDQLLEQVLSVAKEQARAGIKALRQM